MNDGVEVVDNCGFIKSERQAVAALVEASGVTRFVCDLTKEGSALRVIDRNEKEQRQTETRPEGAETDHRPHLCLSSPERPCAYTKKNQHNGISCRRSYAHLTRSADERGHALPDATGRAELGLPREHNNCEHAFNTLITLTLKPICCESWPDLDPLGAQSSKAVGPFWVDASKVTLTSSLSHSNQHGPQNRIEKSAHGSDPKLPAIPAITLG